MRHARIARPAAVLAMLTAATMTSPVAGAQATAAGPPGVTAPVAAPSLASAPLIDEAGNEVGRATFRPAADGVEVELAVKGLSPGRHGVHVHQNGDCAPGPDAAGQIVAFGAAGPHFDPGATANHDRPEQPATVGHGGDLPNLEVGADGNGALRFATEDFALDGDGGIIGRSIVVHAAPDDYSTEPAGGSGARVACGVIAAEAETNPIEARYPLPDEITFPEGIVALPDGTFLVGSSADGAIARVDADGASAVFAPAGQSGRTAALGMATDAEGRIYVAGGATGLVHVLDAEGNAIRSLRVADGEGDSFLNDITVAADGWAYVTDSRRAILHRFALDGTDGDDELEPWLDLSATEFEYQEGFNLNGIVAGESGSFLVAVQSNTGRLWRIDTRRGDVEPIDTGTQRFAAGDGLVLVNPDEANGATEPTLYVVQNASSTITRLRLDPAGRWAEVTGTVRSDALRFPTTAALGLQGLVVVNGQLDQRGASPTLPFDVTLVPFAAFDDRTSASALCAADDGGLTLPEGFCATVFADGLVRARQLTTAPDGTLFAAIAGAPDGSSPGAVAALRDDDGDGRAELIERFGDRGGNGVEFHDGWLYVARNDSIVRYRVEPGTVPGGQAETIVSGLPATPDHAAKTVVVTDDGRLFVNVGSASNACQEDNRVAFSPGVDPCPELDERAGIWEFSATETGQVAADGQRYATGVRNANALDIDPASGALYAAINGRDQLFENWPDRYDEADDLTKPAEELQRIEAGADYGWPYCYFDPALGRHVLAPEYGGDGTVVGRCASLPQPAVTFPAHWAPLSILFPTGALRDAIGQDGALIAFHGSRFDPSNQPEGPGYVVAFAPFSDGEPTGEWSIFADGFAGDGVDLPAEAAHRAVGLAQGPDGALYISDDKAGRIWRVTATTG